MVPSPMFSAVEISLFVICLASRVIDERLTFRLFAESHYADYLPLIAKVRTAILQDSSNRTIPHWLQMTIDLEKRFRGHGMKTG